jgi:hypothetical protein
MPRFAVDLELDGKRQRIELESDSQPTQDQILQAVRQYQQPSNSEASFGNLRMREDQMLKQSQPAQPQAPAQQPSLTPRTDEATRSILSRSLAGPGGGALPVGVAMGEQAPPGTEAQILRYGPAAVAGLATAPATTLGGALIAAGTMGAATGGGELAAQAAEVGMGKREAIQPGEVASSAVLGATPFNVLQGLGGPLKSAAVNAVKQAFVSQSMSALADVFDTALSEGRFPTQKEITDSAFSLSTYLPGAVGGVAGGVSGFASRPVRALTQEEQIGRAAKEAGRRLEGVVGQGQAPLTTAQQTGRNFPGEFPAGSGELAAQQAVPGRVRQAIGQAPAGASMAAESELATASELASQKLAGEIAGSQRVGEALVNIQLQTSIPGVARTGTTAENATAALNSIRAEADRLSQNVTAAYAPFEAEMARLGGSTATYVPTNLQAAVKEVMSSLATVQKTKTIPSPIIGAPPVTITTAEPKALFDQATNLARNLEEVASSPQNVNQLIGLRQQIDDAFSGITEIAPGFGKAQLTKLREALKADELAAARQVGGNTESLLKKAQAVAKNKFDTLEANPILIKALRNPGERNSFQNSEDFFSELASKPEALDAVRKTLTPAQYDQIRRGMFDSLRDIKPIEINGVNFENAQVLANNFRKLPDVIREDIAGSKFMANDLQSILDDAAKAQSVGRTVPVYGGVNQEAINKAFTEGLAIRDPNLRSEVIKNVNDSVNRARRYENEITAQARARTLNPNINEDEFVRNFVLSSNNPAIVRDAMAQLTPATRQAVSKKAAEVFVDHIISSSKTANSLDELIGDKNRLQIVREIMSPNDLELAQDLMKWQRGVLMTGPQGKLDSSEMAKFVWKVTQARALTDVMVGNAAMQNFLSVLAKTPRAVLSLKPTISTATAQRAATGVGAPMLTEIEKAADEARASLPEQLINTFNQAFGFSK